MTAPGNRRGVLFGEFEDADLNQLRDGEVLETTLLHAVNEVRRDFEDADLDEFIECGLIAERANLPYFVGVDALDFEGDELVGVWLFITHGNEALHIGWIDVEDAKGYEVVDGDAVNVRLLQANGRNRWLR